MQYLSKSKEYLTDALIRTFAGAHAVVQQRAINCLLSDDVKRHQAAEAQYNASAEASLDLLKNQPEIWGTKDLWLVLNAFYQCPGRHRIGNVRDGGACARLFAVLANIAMLHLTSRRRALRKFCWWLHIEYATAQAQRRR